MKQIMFGLVLATIAMLWLQGCASSPGMLTANEKGLVFKPVPLSPQSSILGIIAGFAMVHCSNDPKFRGCAGIFCQEDINHPHCTPEAIKRLKKKGVL